MTTAIDIWTDIYITTIGLYKRMVVYNKSAPHNMVGIQQSVNVFKVYQVIGLFIN